MMDETETKPERVPNAGFVDFADSEWAFSMLRKDFNSFLVSGGVFPK